MLDAANLPSGLVGGLIGALVGAGVTFASQWSEHRHQGQIAARAVHAEMGADAAELHMLLRDNESVHPLVMHSWELRAGDVARILPADEFYAVAYAYAMIPICQRIQDRLAARNPPKTLKPGERANLEEAMPHLSRANDILRKRAWKKGEAPTGEGITAQGI